jgi:hypothetical protein
MEEPRVSRQGAVFLRYSFYSGMLKTFHSVGSHGISLFTNEHVVESAPSLLVIKSVLFWPGNSFLSEKAVIDFVIIKLAK